MQNMKNMNWLRLMLLLASFLLLTESCSVKPPDIFVFQALKQRLSIDPITKHAILTPSPTCMKQIKEPSCGHGVSIMLGRQVYIGENKANWFEGKKPWSQVQDESILLPAVESYAPLATYAINICKKENCSDDVTRFKVKIESPDDPSKSGSQ